MAIASTPQVFTDVTVDPFVCGFLHHPAKPNGNGLVLTHGAGSKCNAPLLVALAEAFAEHGYSVLRCDLPFRQDRPYGPPSPVRRQARSCGIEECACGDEKSGERQRLSWRAILTAAGKRACSAPNWRKMLRRNLHHQSLDCCCSPILCIRRRKPDQPRTQHFFHLQTPALFVQGTGDAFGTVAEVEKALQLIPAKTKLMTVEGAGHDLGFKGKTQEKELPETIYAQFQTFFAYDLLSIRSRNFANCVQCKLTWHEISVHPA